MHQIRIANAKIAYHTFLEAVACIKRFLNFKDSNNVSRRQAFGTAKKEVNLC